MTTRRRRIVIALVIVALVALPAIGWVVWREIKKPEPVRAYKRLRLGMTRDEVEAAIGVAPRHPSWEEFENSTPLRASDMLPPHLGEFWTWDGYWISVNFGQNDTAVGLYLYKSGGPPSLLDRVWEFLGL